MRSSSVVGLASLSSLLVLAMPTSAAADPPRTANAVQVAGGFRYGADLEQGDFNPWGTGLGLEVGYTLPSAIYFGGNFDYFFGDTISTPVGEVSGNIWQLAAEGGYDLQATPGVLIRPKLGVGIASLMGETCINGFGCQDDSETDLAVAPGATFMFFPGSVTLALDLRYQMIFADPETLNGIIFSVGIGF